MQGSVETVVFPDLYRSSMLHLGKDSVVLVRGQVDVGEETVKLLLSDVQPLTRSESGGPPMVEITLAGVFASSDGLRRLKALLDMHPGRSSWRLHLQLPEGSQVTIAPAPGLTVAADESLRQDLQEAFGPGSFTAG
jgi:DNA polymerase-3 subunit alpha